MWEISTNFFLLFLTCHMCLKRGSNFQARIGSEVIILATLFFENLHKVFFLMIGIPLLPKWSLTLPSWGQCFIDDNEFHIKSPSKCWANGKVMSMEPRSYVIGHQGNSWTLSVFMRKNQISSGSSNKIESSFSILGKKKVRT